MITTITIQNSTRLKEINDLLNTKTTSASRATLTLTSLVLEGGVTVPLGKVQSKWYSEAKNRLTLKLGG